MLDLWVSLGTPPAHRPQSLRISFEQRSPDQVERLRSLPIYMPGALGDMPGALGDTHKPESILPSLTLINFEQEHLGTPTNQDPFCPV